MKKWIYSVMALVFVMTLSVIAFAEGDLKRIPSPYVGAGTPIQQFCPTATASKLVGTKNVYKNFTTTGLTAIKYQGLNGTTATNIKVRVGGFSGASGGTETDYIVNNGDTVWIGKGVSKVGFSAITSIAPGTTVNIQKQ